MRALVKCVMFMDTSIYVIRIYVYMNTYICIHKYIHIRILQDVDDCSCSMCHIYGYKYIHVYVICIYVYINTYIYIHKYIYIYILQDVDECISMLRNEGFNQVLSPTNPADR